MEDYIHKVQYYETDRMGVTHHSNYIRWMEEARVDFLDKVGWNYSKLEEMGIISPITEVECKYINSTTFDDVITVRIYLENFTGVKLKLNYEMTDSSGKTVCKGHSENCFLSKDKKIISLRNEYPNIYHDIVDKANKME